MRTLLLPAALLLSAACSQPGPTLARLHKAELASVLQREVGRSVEAEKSAVLATTDEASERFAAESRRASGEVDRVRSTLRSAATPDELERLDAFDAAWARVAAVDAQILPLAVANTNLKAGRLSMNEATKALDAVLAAFAQVEAQTSDPARLRELSAASVAALRVQALHAPHIVSADAAEMAAQEARARELEEVVDRLFATFAKRAPPKGAAAAVEAALPAWSDYKATTAKIFELSRANTNVRSLELSLREKVDASRACDAALAALVGKLHDAPNPTR
jgi:hypothetical protein